MPRPVVGISGAAAACATNGAEGAANGLAAAPAGADGAAKGFEPANGLA